mgnify:CR=1 FL=1
MVCGLSLHDAATGAVVSGDGGVGVSLGSYADVLATDPVRVAVKAQVCGSDGGDGTPSLDGVAVTFRDVDADADADLGVFPQPDGCPAVADRLADGCSHCFTPDGAALLGALAGVYGLHPLACEDVLMTPQRPKVEQYEVPWGGEGRWAFLVPRNWQEVLPPDVQLQEPT